MTVEQIKVDQALFEEFADTIPAVFFDEFIASVRAAETLEQALAVSLNASMPQLLRVTVLSQADVIARAAKRATLAVQLWSEAQEKRAQRAPYVQLNPQQQYAGYERFQPPAGSVVCVTDYGIFYIDNGVKKTLPPKSYVELQHIWRQPGSGPGFRFMSMRTNRDTCANCGRPLSAHAVDDMCPRV